MDPRKPLILAALSAEARALCRALRNIDHDLRLIGPSAARLTDLNRLQPSCVILAGLAGGLDPRLRTADLILDGADQHTADQLGAFLGHIHGSRTVVRSAQEKATLFRQTRALAIDMESDPVRQACHAAGARLFILRAILDPASESLDPALLRLLTPAGHLRLAPLFTHPRLLLHLPRLAVQCSRALRALAPATAGLLRIIGARDSAQA